MKPFIIRAGCFPDDDGCFSPGTDSVQDLTASIKMKAFPFFSEKKHGIY